MIFDKTVQSIRDDTTIHLCNDLQFSELFHVDPQSNLRRQAGWVLLTLSPQEKIEVTLLLELGPQLGSDSERGASTFPHFYVTKMTHPN